MSSSYQTLKGVQSYLKFINSEDGLIFKDILSKAILSRLTNQNKLSVLDAGCGNGWLSQIISTKGHSVLGCDISSELLALAKNNYPNIQPQNLAAQA